MARFISRHSGYGLKVRDSVVKLITDRSGTTYPHVERADLIVQFRGLNSGVGPNMIREFGAAQIDNVDISTIDHVTSQRAEIEQALAHWGARRRDDGTPAALGAIPHISNGVTDDGKPYVGFQFLSTLGLFDTDWLDNEDDKADALKGLRENSDLGIAYIEVEAPVLGAPWPNYDLIKGKRGAGGSIADQIKRRIVEDGYDADLVEKYERANKGRDDVLAAIDEARVEIATRPEISDDELEIDVK